AAIVAPVYFMENAFFGLAQLRQGVYGSPLAPTRRLMQVAVSDIAGAVVAALEDRARYAGKRFDLAGDELSGEEVVAILSKVTGHSADRAALRRDFPEVPWLPFEAWARAQDWKKLLAG